MIDFLSNWAQGIIVAVIIATIIEMILPNGSAKKYVKVVVGIYILFTIISPIITKISNNNFNINDILDTKEYEEKIAKSDKDISKKIEENNNRTIKDIYQANLESDIKAKLKDKGYEVLNTYIKIRDDENYTIEFISLSLDKNEIEETNQVKNIEIEEVNIQIGGTNTQEIDNSLASSEKQEIAEYISSTYNIDIKSIEIL